MISIHQESPVAAGRFAAWLHLHGTDATVKDCEVVCPDDAELPLASDLNQIFYWVEEPDQLPGYYGIRDGSSASGIQWIYLEGFPGLPWLTVNRADAVAYCRVLSVITRCHACSGALQPSEPDTTF